MNAATRIRKVFMKDDSRKSCLIIKVFIKHAVVAIVEKSIKEPGLLQSIESMDSISGIKIMNVITAKTPNIT